MSSEPFVEVSNGFKRGAGPSELNLWLRPVHRPAFVNCPGCRPGGPVFVAANPRTRAYFTHFCGECSTSRTGWWMAQSDANCALSTCQPVDTLAAVDKRAVDARWSIRAAKSLKRCYFRGYSRSRQTRIRSLEKDRKRPLGTLPFNYQRNGKPGN